jgi:serine/threonine protein phosphatase PrpC
MSKDWISEQLVLKAIQNGSPDNVTVVIANLAELYSRWQRSTPFQVNTKGIRYSLGNELYDKFRNKDYDFQ